MKKYYLLLIILLIISLGLVGFLVYRASSTDLLFSTINSREALILQ